MEPTKCSAIAIAIARGARTGVLMNPRPLTTSPRVVSCSLGPTPSTPTFCGGCAPGSISPPPPRRCRAHRMARRSATASARQGFPVPRAADYTGGPRTATAGGEGLILCRCRQRGAVPAEGRQRVGLSNTWSHCRRAATYLECRRCRVDPNLLRTGHTPYTTPWRPSVLPLHFADLNTEHSVLFGVELWFEDSNSVYWGRNIYGKLAELTDAVSRNSSTVWSLVAYPGIS
jgi:hypothetical protein